MTQLIFRSRTKTTVGDQINTVCKQTRTEHGEVNAKQSSLYTHSSVTQVRCCLPLSSQVEVHGPVMATQAEL